MAAVILTRSASRSTSLPVAGGCLRPVWQGRLRASSPSRQCQVYLEGNANVNSGSGHRLRFNVNRAIDQSNSLPHAGKA